MQLASLAAGVRLVQRIERGDRAVHAYAPARPEKLKKPGGEVSAPICARRPTKAGLFPLFPLSTFKSGNSE